MAERVLAGRATGNVRVFRGLPGYVRQAWGPGWALVGDAGYWKDPVTSHGLTDALRDAELLARAVGARRRLRATLSRATRRPGIACQLDCSRSATRSPHSVDRRRDQGTAARARRLGEDEERLTELGVALPPMGRNGTFMPSPTSRDARRPRRRDLKRWSRPDPATSDAPKGLFEPDHRAAGLSYRQRAVLVTATAGASVTRTARSPGETASQECPMAAWRPGWCAAIDEGLDDAERALARWARRVARRPERHRSMADRCRSCATPGTTTPRSSADDRRSSRCVWRSRRSTTRSALAAGPRAARPGTLRQRCAKPSPSAGHVAEASGLGSDVMGRSPLPW